MTYGDGDGRVFTDFTKSDDVIGHELTHGVTQFTAGLDYSDEPGALNESVSDVFGAMFHQWRRKQTVAQADWLIGPGVLGPVALAKGYTCLRNMAQPGSRECLSPQPSNYSDYVPGGDPHENSGIPNHAFYLAATTIGGQAWQKAGKVWYAALTSDKARPSTGFSDFAKLTRAAAKSLIPPRYQRISCGRRRLDASRHSRSRHLALIRGRTGTIEAQRCKTATSLNDAAASPA